MKKVIEKNQVIITSLAILIAVAGYLNFADVDLGFKDKEASTDSSSILEDAGYDLTDETALLDENQADGGLTDNSLTDSQETDTPGEAVLTGSTGFAAQAKISREQVRSQNKADLQDIINNEEIDDEEKQEAIQYYGFHDRSYRKRSGSRASCWKRRALKNVSCKSYRRNCGCGSPGSRTF